MSTQIGIAIEALVALLLAITIVYCMLLNRRLARLKADEQTLKSTIGELINATEIAERAIAGLKNAAQECDEGLGRRLRVAEAMSANLSRQTTSGEQLVAKLVQIAGLGGGEASSQAPAPRHAPAQPQSQPQSQPYAHPPHQAAAGGQMQREAAAPHAPAPHAPAPLAPAPRAPAAHASAAVPAPAHAAPGLGTAPGLAPPREPTRPAVPQPPAPPAVPDARATAAAAQAFAARARLRARGAAA